MIYRKTAKTVNILTIFDTVTFSPKFCTKIGVGFCAYCTTVILYIQFTVFFELYTQFKLLLFCTQFTTLT